MFSKTDLENYIEWDYYAWGEALVYWQNQLPKDLTGKKALELGGRRGGLALYLAKKGAEVTCSDVTDISEETKSWHQELGYGNINYEVIDATNIGHEEEFDIIIFKSILGGIGSHDNFLAQQKTIDSIQRALKPGGILLYSENMKSSPFHILFRSIFRPWSKRWRYLTLEDVNTLLSNFTHKDHFFGFFSVFGRLSFLKFPFYLLDKLICPILPKKFNYILFGIANKR